MPTTPKASTKKSPPGAKKSNAAGLNAIKLLTNDHKEVKALFNEYQALVDNDADGAARQALAEKICVLLTVHATVEEEFFYPAGREVLEDDEDLIDEADVEHASAKDLIAQLRNSTPADPHYDAKVKVLGEYIDHHVKEEEGEMFPKVRKTDLDLENLGQAMADRKDELMAQLAPELAQA